MSLSGFRSFLFRLNSLLGDVQAVRKGPTGIVKRVLRKEANKLASKIINNTYKD